MEYRQLPHEDAHERVSVLGLGMGGIFAWNIYLYRKYTTNKNGVSYVSK